MFTGIYKEKNKFSSNYLLHVLLSRTQEQNIYIYTYIYLFIDRSTYLSIYLKIDKFNMCIIIYIYICMFTPQNPPKQHVHLYLRRKKCSSNYLLHYDCLNRNLYIIHEKDAFAMTKPIFPIQTDTRSVFIAATDAGKLGPAAAVLNAMYSFICLTSGFGRHMLRLNHLGNCNIRKDAFKKSCLQRAYSHGAHSQWWQDESFGSAQAYPLHLPWLHKHRRAAPNEPKP